MGLDPLNRAGIISEQFLIPSENMGKICVRHFICHHVHSGALGNDLVFSPTGTRRWPNLCSSIELVYE